MQIAADYPFLDILWTMILFFAWVAWIWIMIVILGDLFRRSDKSGWGKAFWVVCLILFPFVGTLVYLIANGRGMAERAAERTQVQQAEMADYIRSVAPRSNGGAASEIAKAKQLLDDGAITEAEFQSIKDRTLAAA